MSKLKHLIQFLLGLLSYLMDIILQFVPRDRHKWVYGASGGFRDNPKYLYLQANYEHPEINSIWIGRVKSDVFYLRSRGLNACYYLSLKGLYHTMTAGVAICDHQLGNINCFLLGGAYYVNLWHGSSVKRVRWQNTDAFVKEYHLRNKEEMRTSFVFRMMLYQVLFKRPDFCLTPSTIQAKEFFAPMMDMPLDNCVVGVFPRSLLLIAGKGSALDFIRKNENQETLEFVERLNKFNKVYIYMPTWRRTKSDFIAASGIDWEKLNESLNKKNELLILKLHPHTKLNMDAITNYSNLMIYQKNSDVYTVLPFIDCLITDYSSIYTDFLMMNKEIILYIFDYEDYVHNSNDLGDYDKYYVGKRAYDFNQLLHIIESGKDCHVPQDKYHELMEFFWDNNRHQIDIVEEVKKRISL